MANFTKGQHNTDGVPSTSPPRPSGDQLEKRHSIMWCVHCNVIIRAFLGCIGAGQPVHPFTIILPWASLNNQAICHAVTCTRTGARSTCIHWTKKGCSSTIEGSVLQANSYEILILYEIQMRSAGRRQMRFFASRSRDVRSLKSKWGENCVFISVHLWRSNCEENPDNCSSKHTLKTISLISHY